MSHVLSPMGLGDIVDEDEDESSGDLDPVQGGGSGAALASSSAFLSIALRVLGEQAGLLSELETVFLPAFDRLLAVESVRPEVIELQNWIVQKIKHGRVALPGSRRNDIRMSGWLLKRGGASGMKYQRRFFKLWGRELSYYADGKGLTLKGQIDLGKCVCVEVPGDNFDFEIRALSKGEKIKKTEHMKSQTTEKKGYRLRAISAEEMNAWMDAIRFAANHADVARAEMVREEIFGSSPAGDGGAADGAVVHEAEKQEYVDLLQSYERMTEEHPILLPCDWLHQQIIRRRHGHDGKLQRNQQETIDQNRDVAADLEQVYKDLQRDQIVVNGDNYDCPTGDEVIFTLYNSIMAKRQPPPMQKSAQRTEDEREALAYARAILLASVRTVCGGEAYDAVDFMFRHKNLVFICPESSETLPLRLIVQDAPANYNQEVNSNSMTVDDVVSDETELSVPASSSTMNMVRAMSGVLKDIRTRGRTVSFGKSHTAEATPQKPLSRCESGSSLDGGKRKSHFTQLTERYQGSGIKSSSKLRPMKAGNGDDYKTTIWPVVRVEAESCFKVMALDPIEEIDFEPYVYVYATFEREFVWGRHTHLKPASVKIEVSRRLRSVMELEKVDKDIKMVSVEGMDEIELVSTMADTIEWKQAPSCGSRADPEKVEMQEVLL